MLGDKFKLLSKFKPAGDQPRAIKQLIDGLKKGYDHQTLLGVTGSGKTFTIANVIAEIQKPTLVIAHNKTLAAQLTNEFRGLFPHNSVNYFVSYYDYYQPEAYIPSTDTYIDKEAMINDEIDKLRHAATTALLTRRDVIVVASVSCIYGLGAPEVYAENIFHFKVGDRVDRKSFARKLIELQFTRTTSDLKRGTYRLRGDNWEIMPPDKEVIYNFELEGGPFDSAQGKKIKKIYEIDPVRGKTLWASASSRARASNGVDPVRGRPADPVRGLQPGRMPTLPEIFIAPAKHFITLAPERERAITAIKEELRERLKYFEANKKYLEAERLERRTKFDLAMVKEVGYCHGIENYSRHLSGRAPGEPPATLLDYFVQERGQTQTTRGLTPHQSKLGAGQAQAESGVSEFLTVIDESHVTVPQIRGMFDGDTSRKKTLIEYGFRLPSAADNRPLKFKEFEERVGQIIYTSATPAAYERKKSQQIVEQIIRPTGLVDPKITVRPVCGQALYKDKPYTGQVDDLIERIEKRVERKERILVTTLTKRMAEDLAEYLSERKETHLRRGFGGQERENEKEALERRTRGIKVAYLHSDVKTLDRIRILTNLRKGKFDVLVGVNLLREGLDLPEVSLVAILDADKEGFLRSETSLIQTIGRAARNVHGEVLIYADHITGSIERALAETERRRILQLAYNKKHGITPKTIVKEIKDILPDVGEVLKLEMKPIPKSREALEKLIENKEREMREAARQLDFELAAILRDELKVLIKESKRRILAISKLSGKLSTK